ncbi:MAG TPA: hypothetical protein GXX36_08780 [Clostridiaceae bacterium]|nr:hypothetical protein [Clostridiaceae bacterium]
MKTLILFSSRYGATEKCANLIMKGLRDDAEVINLKNGESKDIDNYDVILIGGGVYAGKLQSEITKFIEDNKECLRNKKVGVFLCCKESEKTSEYAKANLPAWLVNDLFLLENTGYEINFERMNFLEKFLFKSLFKIKRSYSDLKYDSIEKIVNEVNRMGG